MEPYRGSGDRVYVWVHYDLPRRDKGNAMTRYKCSNCKVAFEAEEPLCPLCNTSDAVKVMCPRDHCNCSHDVIESIAYCPECGEPMCPICESHDVSQLSRVTGYLADVAGFNAGKKQELKDRKRYNPVGE